MVRRVEAPNVAARKDAPLRAYCIHLPQEPGHRQITARRGAVEITTRWVREHRGSRASGGPKDVDPLLLLIVLESECVQPRRQGSAARRRAAGFGELVPTREVRCTRSQVVGREEADVTQ